MMNQPVQTLTEELRHSDKNVRGKAAVSIGKLDDTANVHTLIDALITEPDMYVREDITWALVRIKDAAFQPLLNLLDDANPATRHLVTHVLSKIGGSAVVEPLIHALHDSDAPVISKAAFGLAQIGDKRAIPPLVALVGHDNREVQTMLMDVLERFGTASVQPLMDLMSSPRWKVREQAVDILGAMKAKAAMPVLIVALKDEAWQVRFAAVTALNHIGGKQSQAAIQAMPADVEEHVQTLLARVKQRLRW